MTVLVQVAAAPADTIGALTELVKAVQASSHPEKAASPWLTPDGIRAISGLIAAIAWPAIALFVLVVFRPQIVNLAGRVQELEVWGVKAKVKNEIEAAAQAAENAPDLTRAPTPEEAQRAIQVEKLTAGADLTVMRRQAEELALEYEKVRASMRASDARTRAMEVVVAKMRTIGRAAYPLRYELMASPSPGRRLQAIACLEIQPDYESLDWLVQRLGVERPFLEYHALVALNEAASDKRGREHLPELQDALAKAKAAQLTYSVDADREALLTRFEARVGRIAAGLKPS